MKTRRSGGRLSFAAVILLGVEPLGCLPLPDPHFEYSVPEMRGSFVQDGRPVAQLDIRVHLKGGAREIDEKIVSDANGQFVLPGEGRSFRLFTFFPLLGIAEAFYRWQVCFTLSDGQEACYYRSIVTPGGAPSKLQLACDLSNVAAAIPARSGRALRSEADARLLGSRLCRDPLE